MLGVPFGHPEFVKKFLQKKNSEHKVLLDRIPAIQDTQSAWLLLSFCAGARSNSFIRAVSPQFTQEFAQAHDEGVWQCLCRILSLHADCGAQEQSSLPLWEGGIGLRSARQTAPAAHWASWADALKMIRDRHPAVVDIILDALRRPQESRTIRTVVECAGVLERTGFECPSWEDLAEGRSPGESRSPERRWTPLTTPASSQREESSQRQVFSVKPTKFAKYTSTRQAKRPAQMVTISICGLLHPRGAELLVGV